MAGELAPEAPQPPNRKLAACRGVDTDIFFADEKDKFTVAIAKRYCDHCVERVRCLDWAMANGEKGIWGGLTDNERAKIKRKVSRVRCPGCASYDVLEATETSSTEICLACGLSWNT